MKKQKIDVKFVDEWPEGEIVELYKAGGWWKSSWDTSGVKSLISRSFAFAVAVDLSSNRAVGMGRLISEGVSDAYIQDLVVLPQYRSQGFGRQLVADKLREKIADDPDAKALNTPDGWKLIYKEVYPEVAKIFGLKKKAETDSGCYRSSDRNA